MTARVLVVDDLLPNVKLLEARLSAEYFQVMTAMNGATLIARPGGHHFDNNATTLGDHVVAALKAKGLP